MRPRLPLCLAAGLMAGTASLQGQTFKYLAFGDSITCGKYDNPNICSGSEPIPNPATKTGYPGDLHDLLGCTGGGSSCRVYNYGDPGEGATSSQALTRLQNVLANGNGPYDVLLLMHGTNDVNGGTSNAAIKFDLQVMDDKAALVGVDTVFASIIRFDPSGSAHTSGKQTQIQNLRNDLATIAANRDSWFADPWAVLCPDTPCFNSHYTDQDNGQGLHPDNTGYDILAGEFEGTILQASVPSTPGNLSPTGGAGDATGVVTWTTSNNANWYQVRRDGGAASWWVAEQSVCSGSNCSWQVTGLTPGDHTWSVRARNPRGRSAFSAAQSFHYYSSPPNPPDAVSPITDHYGTPPSTFTWTDEAAATNGATGYQLKIERDQVQVFNQDVAGTCDGNQCDHDPGLTWTPGIYSWQVRSENPAGDSAWSTEAEFLFTDVAPAIPTALEPSIDTFDTTPLFTWTHEFGAAEYVVQIDSDPEETVDAATACGPSICSWLPTGALSVGVHDWKVKAKNPLGQSSYSSDQSFEVLACSPADLTLDSGSVTGSEQEAACHTITAEGTYKVAGSNGDLALHAGDSISLNAGFRVEQGGTLHCRVDP